MKYQLLATAMAIGLGIVSWGHGAQAAFLTGFNNSQVVVDASSAVRNINIGSPGVILDVNIMIDFMKCDDPLATPLPGACIGQGNSFAREIVFNLTSPLGTVVSLVAQDTYFNQQAGPAPGARVTVLFDDAAATAVGGNNLVSGAFNPVGLLSAFNLENPIGNWILSIQDTVGADPLGFARADLFITTAVPEPATLTLFGLGLAGLGFARRRRKSAA